MFLGPKILPLAFASLLLVQAQNTTTSASTSSPSSVLDSCIVGCVTSAAGTAGCSSYTDLSCVCFSTTFQQSALQCLQANCTAADVSTATTLQQQECAALSSGGVSTTASTSATSSPVSTATSPVSTTTGPASTAKSSTKTGASSSASQSTTSSSASSGASSSAAMGAPLSFGTLISTLVASAGALVGAAFVL